MATRVNAEVFQCSHAAPEHTYMQNMEGIRLEAELTRGLAHPHIIQVREVRYLLQPHKAQNDRFTP